MNRATFTFIIPCLVFAFSSLQAQSSIDELFDQSVGKENLPLNNGVFYYNLYKTNNTNQYYHTNKYFVGNIIYENQFYNNVNLKYDIYKDILIFKPYGESENFGIELINDKVSQFSINNKNFINLSAITKDSIKGIKGYYEENFTSERITFYIKHKKGTKTFIQNQAVYNDFEIENEFLLLMNNNYNQIKNKKDVVTLFTQYKNEINNFYSDNSKLQKINKTEFYEKLFRFIDNLSFSK